MDIKDITLRDAEHGGSPGNVPGHFLSWLIEDAEGDAMDLTSQNFPRD